MPDLQFGSSYGGTAPENYQRYFVPAIGAPVANDLMRIASLRPGERVLDVACGTGVVTRMASRMIGEGGTVAGLDVNPGMLAVAKESTPPGMVIEWHEASAEEMPFPDASYDVILCQMGLQFIPDRSAALTEMNRVLTSGGRLIMNLPGPTPPAFESMAEALTRHIGPQAAGFINQIFLLHDTTEVQNLLLDADFLDVAVDSQTLELHLPAPEEFLWQFVNSTPLAAAVAPAGEEMLAALERDVIAGWLPFILDQALVIQVRIVTTVAHKV